MILRKRSTVENVDNVCQEPPVNPATESDEVAHTTPSSSPKRSRYSTRSKSKLGGDASIPVEVGLHIGQLPDEVLVKIFSFVDSCTVCVSIARVCKKWNLLSKDRDVWVEVDFTRASLVRKDMQVILKKYCSSTTKSLALRAPSERYTCPTAWPPTTRVASKCLSRPILDSITKQCPTLQSFTIAYEQMHSSLSGTTLASTFVMHLPRSLKQLRLPYCVLSYDQFHGVFSKDSPLSGLLSLDLTGVAIPYIVWLEKNHLPPALQTLTLRNCALPFNDAEFFFSGVIANHPSLRVLDMGVTHIDHSNLKLLATNLINLEELNMSGCLLARRHCFAMDPYDDSTEKEGWFSIWREGFPMLTKLNVRNVRLCNGKLLRPIMRVVSSSVTHLIDTNRKMRGDWTDDFWRDEDPLEHKNFNICRRQNRTIVANP